MSLSIRRMAAGAACGLTLCAAWPWSAGAVATTPTGSTLLAAGQIHKTKWHVVAARPTGREGAGNLAARRPCLGIQIAESRGSALQLRTNELCYGGPAYLDANAEPLIVNEVLGFSNRRHLQTLVAIALPSAVRELRLDDIVGGQPRSFSARLITRIEARESRLRRFRFVVFRLLPQECVRKFSAVGRRGVVLWESGDLSCSDGEGADWRGQG
jgi:hypothetical protein